MLPFAGANAMNQQEEQRDNKADSDIPVYPSRHDGSGIENNIRSNKDTEGE
ncbi:unknown protein [Paenibacillus amylolyticus]|uniref:Uncharacterized protein n=1 Tax=Paenibacillus amylolyticus TaxID=1451 RepID=A0A124DYT6_PAEAM|nr:unknown protein [Paenibacillus amylolyticus]